MSYIFAFSLFLFLSPSCTQTYSVDKQVADSASTATAYHCGVKANAKTLGLNAKAVVYECNTTFGNEVHSVLRRAKAQGMHSGFWQWRVGNHLISYLRHKSRVNVLHIFYRHILS